jgi:flavin reductase (DIM6/NTAB) family NADH-FMN oxidoreductase RutF
LYDTTAHSVFAICQGGNPICLRRANEAAGIIAQFPGAALDMSGSIAALFQRLTQGVYVVGVAVGERRDAFTAAWVMQVSYDPLLLALSVNAKHSSYRLLKESGFFSVNVLKKGQLDLADRYGRPAQADKLVFTDWTNDRIGPPVLREGLAWFECEMVDEYPAGDHVLVVGRVVDGKLVDWEAEPMCYRETGAMDGASTLYPDVFGES